MTMSSTASLQPDPFRPSLFQRWQRWFEALAFVEALYRSRRRHALTHRR
jgi:hypothetical protein